MFAEQGRGMGGTGPRQFVQGHSPNALDATVGIVLIVVGGIFYAQQFLGFDPWRWSWPFLVVVPGVVLLLAALTMGRGASGLAIPGTMTTAVGLILLFQNTFAAWQTWAYAWALIFPTSVGIGLWLHALLSDRETVQRTGRTMAIVGIWIFVGFATFFELLLNLSGRFGPGVGGPGIAVILILAGVFLLRPSVNRTTM